MVRKESVIMKVNIASNIRRLRTQKGITQEELASAMNVTCAAISKWERGETFPDISLLQPLAYYFGITLDELMGYDREKIQAEIENIITTYINLRRSDPVKAREVICHAHHEFPNDYRIMHYYMWNIAGDVADNDPVVLTENKAELLCLCEKILAGCADEEIRLGAWNMRAKILHAEGRTEEALEIYRTKFSDWYETVGQKTEQLFAKDSEAYYRQVRINMYELFCLAADKWGRSLFFCPACPTEEKVSAALRYGELLLNAYRETEEVLFLVTAQSFLVRMRNDCCYRGGTDAQIIALTEKVLCILKELAEYNDRHPDRSVVLPSKLQGNVLARYAGYYRNEANSRMRELLKSPEYTAVLSAFCD